MRRALFKRYGKITAKVLLDAAVAAGALLAAFALRYGGAVPEPHLHTLTVVVAFVVVVKTGLNYVLGLHSRIWHYTSAHETVILSGGAAGASAGLLLLAWAGIIPVPRSVLLIDAGLYLLGVAGLRLTRRMQVTYVKKRAGPNGPRELVRTLVVGAGDTANSLLADLESRNHTNWNVIGLLDDDPAKRGAKLRGFPVLGATTQLEWYLQHRNVEHVVLAMPSAQKAVIRGLINRAQSRGATVQAVPALEDLLRNGKPATGSMPITLADLVDSAEVKKTLLSSVKRHRKPEQVLVTGGAGYIGGRLVRKLLDRGYRVRVLDNFTYGTDGIDPLRTHPNLEVMEGDISSVRDVVAAVKDVDRVIALAAIVGDPACGLNAEETLNLNYESTKILIESCNFYGVQRFVFASSCSVYGASDNRLLTETSALNPVSLYARTRIMSEDVLFDRCGDVEPVVLRLSTVFGYSARMRFDLVVNLLTARAVVDRKIKIFGGDQWRPFVHCEDAAEAFIQAAIAPSELVRGEIFNTGGNHMNHTITQVGEVVAAEVGDDVELEVVGVVDDPRNYRVSFDKIHGALGFHPETDIRAGVREIIAAMRDTPRLREYEDVVYSNLKLLKDRIETAGTGTTPARYLGIR